MVMPTPSFNFEKHTSTCTYEEFVHSPFLQPPTSKLWVEHFSKKAFEQNPEFYRVFNLEFYLMKFMFPKEKKKILENNLVLKLLSPSLIINSDFKIRNKNKGATSRKRKRLFEYEAFVHSPLHSEPLKSELWLEHFSRKASRQNPEFYRAFNMQLNLLKLKYPKETDETLEEKLVLKLLNPNEQ
uniref:Uncharacterized protein n=1 Tax=Clastoptera arizonana TaxID=38151 RepID=A0A1B6C6R6_9HEMI